MIVHHALTALAAGLLAAIVAGPPVVVTAMCPAHGGGAPASPPRPQTPSSSTPAKVAPGKAPEVATKTDAAPAPPRTAPKPSVAPAKPVVPPLDLSGLEKRLRDTKAIGMFTKLSLKNQVDDLLEQFKAFHQGRGDATLDELRERYNLLMLKVLSLLQRDDPPLARDLTASRDAIWGILTDPVKFANVTGGG